MQTDVPTVIVEHQRLVCSTYGALWMAAPQNSIVGVARNVRTGAWPLNGLRHRAEGRTCGWYLWSGEGGPDPADDYFQAVHLSHLYGRCPEALAYLGLPPGWRFLIAPGHRDVWEDLALLDE
jgi:hypothetical protein